MKLTISDYTRVSKNRKLCVDNILTTFEDCFFNIFCTFGGKKPNGYGRVKNIAEKSLTQLYNELSMNRYE